MARQRPPGRSGDRLTRGHGALLALLAPLVLFEGFDVSATSVVLPFLARDFGTTPLALGRALGIIAVGSIVAWALVRLADHVGRRPVLIGAAAGFSLGSLATASVGGVAGYAAVQFVTRALLVTLIATAYLIVAETVPAAVRGRANGVLGALGSFGATLPFLLLGWAATTPLGWRAVFLVGALPLLTVPLLLARVPETPVWLAARAAGAPRLSPLAELRRLASPALAPRFAGMSALWFLVNFASSASSLFFTLYVVRERGWAPGDFAIIAPIGLVGCLLGYLLAGALMDWLGRRWTLILFMAALGLLAQLCYLAHGRWAVAGGFLGLQAALGVWVVAYTLNSELFPTELRAAANGWCHNLIGRWGVVLAPWLLGAMTGGGGRIGPAAAWLGCSAFLAIPLAWLALPETRARRLDQPDPPLTAPGAPAGLRA